jgi:hypothetical protein
MRADEAITAAAKSDLDAQPLTVKQLDAMVLMQGLRGRPWSGLVSSQQRT